MGKKIVRTYYSTFVDVEVDENDFNDEHEMMEYVRLNMTDNATPEEVYNNMCWEHIDQEVLEAPKTMTEDEKDAFKKKVFKALKTAYDEDYITQATSFAELKDMYWELLEFEFSHSEMETLNEDDIALVYEAFNEWLKA